MQERRNASSIGEDRIGEEHKHSKDLGRLWLRVGISTAVIERVRMISSDGEGPNLEAGTVGFVPGFMSGGYP
jgi:hypothetical protein